MTDPEFQEVELARERTFAMFPKFPPPPAENFHPQSSRECPQCGSENISDRQGHIRPEGDESPPWKLVCEEYGCQYEWETDE